MTHSTVGVVVRQCLLILLLSCLRFPLEELISSIGMSSSKCTKLFLILRIDCVYALEKQMETLCKVLKIRSAINMYIGLIISTLIAFHCLLAKRTKREFVLCFYVECSSTSFIYNTRTFI